MKPHKHAEIIKAWADGMEVQCKQDNGTWRDLSTMVIPWFDGDEYRIKPAAPKWPETTMSFEQLAKSEKRDQGYKDALFSIANAAIAHACETEQVVTKSDYDSAIERLGASLRPVVDSLRDARDLRIAEAVAHAYQHAKYTIAGPDAVDLAAIIAGG